ncbi:CidA/LrgA family holin-like protein [Cohnella ginsengisoli]|uniref:CidA/LrgA family holin-like protein n=1 Tax=Cohnella ginsengisoli TaxID=425004 RepID=A0A9X4KDZ2_9BACL|nr:CidA/LrgA family holin-like protein [Cohnella ginsengisoli]MDG0789849.1 CidA/LrgA family holin-like protein [Cohnella ginsengisoli]
MKTNQIVKIALQVGFFTAWSRASEMAAEALRSPIPGSILGLLALFALLELKIVKLSWIELGADWLVAQMLLFFVPATVGIVRYKPLIVQSGAEILATILLSTAIVMSVAGLAGERAGKARRGKAAS